MRFVAAGVSISLLLYSTQMLHAQSSVCDAWEGLMAARNTGFVHISGKQYRQEDTQTVFGSTIRLGDSWDGVYVARAVKRDVRRFEALQAGFMARWAADSFLNREIRKLKACLSGYTLLKDPALLVAGTTYYITDAAGLAKRRAIATVGYKHLKYDVYEAVFSMRSMDQMEIIPREALPVVTVPVRPPGSSTINSQDFAQKIRQLLGYAKTGFAAIKGEKETTRTFPGNKTDFILPGAERVVILNVGIGMDYEAYYGYRISRAEADRIFDELRKLLIAALPPGFKDKGVVEKAPDKSIEFVNDSEMLEVDIRLTDMSTAKNEYNVRLYVSQRFF